MSPVGCGVEAHRFAVCCCAHTQRPSSYVECEHGILALLQPVESAHDALVPFSACWMCACTLIVLVSAPVLAIHLPECSFNASWHAHSVDTEHRKITG